MIDAERLRGWAMNAPVGGSLVLGCGPKLPPLLGAAVRGLTDAGVIVPVRKRAGADAFLFQAQRVSGLISGSPRARNAAPGRFTLAGPRSLRAARSAERTHERARVLAAVRADIRYGRPCRTNAELARDCDVTGGRTAVSAIVRQLAQAGLLHFEMPGPQYRRRAFDPASGRRTMLALL